MGASAPGGSETVATAPVACADDCATCSELTAGARVIAAVLGVAAVTDEQLAARVGASPEVFADHMGGAEQSLLAAHDESVARVHAVWERALERGSTWHDGILAGVRGMLEHLDGDLACGLLCFAHVNDGGRALRLRSDAARRRLADLIVQHHERHGLGGRLPIIQFELMVVSWWAAIGESLRVGRHEQLTDMRDGLLDAAAVFEPILA